MVSIFIVMIVVQLVTWSRPDPGQVQLRGPGRAVGPEEDPGRQHRLNQTRLADLRRCLIGPLLVGKGRLRHREEDKSEDDEEC